MTTLFKKLTHVIDKMFHEDLFDEPKHKHHSSKRCKRGRCCCKHRSHSYEKKSIPKTTYSNTKPTYPPIKPISPPIKPISQKPCQSCYQQKHYQHLHHENQHDQHHEHQHHEHHEHQHHEHQHHEHQHHDHEHQNHYEEEVYGNHIQEENHHHHHETNGNEVNQEIDMDEEYRRFYYGRLSQMNIQKTVEPVYSLEYEVDHAISYGEND